MLKIYTKCITILTLIIVEFGMIAPAFISEKDTLSVLIGFGSIVVVLPLIVILGKSVLNNIRRVYEKN